MAKKFTGFKPETMQNKILPALGYKGAMDQKSINAFLAASPAAAAKMGKYTMIARQMVEGKPVVNANTGFNFKAGFEQAKKDTMMDLGKMTKDQDYYDRLPDRTARSQAAMKNIGKDIFGRDASPSGVSPSSLAASRQAAAAKAASGTPLESYQTGDVNSAAATRGGGMPSGSNLTTQIAQDPTKPVTVANVVSTGGGAATQIADTAGQAGAANTAALTPAGTAQQAAAPTTTPAAQMTAAQSQDKMQGALSGMSGEQGEVSAQSLMNAAQMNPQDAASLDLEAAQLDQAQTVQAPTPLQVSQDQLIEGSAVKQGQVDATLAKAEAALVQDEMADLMQDFEGGNTPVWAAGAMRAANAAMAARGLSA